MNIRRFVAPDMREALKAVRATLGEDAVMLASRSVPGGVEITAAVDYDEVAAEPEDPPAGLGIDELLDDSLARHGARPPRVAAYREVAAEATAPAEARAAQEPDTAELKEELRDLRRLLESQLASFAWTNLERRVPERARMLREMSRYGIDPEITRALLEEIPASDDSRRGLRALVRKFGDRLPLVERDLTDRGGVFALVGPTGVGKTTTIAKIAARFILRHSAEELALVSTDNYRIGARQQLLTFARILGVPMQPADGPAELARVLDGLQRKKLVLIDTAGMSQRDVRLAEQLAALKVDGHAVRPVLALSAAADPACLAEAVTAFQAVEPQALILTKLDEAAQLGPVLSVAIKHALPIAYLTDGQRVPEDLHNASPKRFWLLQRAIRLALDQGAEPDETALAERFGHLELAANA